MFSCGRQRVGEAVALRDEAMPSPAACSRPVIGVSAERARAAGGREGTGQRPQQGGLAGTGGTGHRQQPARARPQVDAVQGDHGRRTPTRSPRPAACSRRLLRSAVPSRRLSCSAGACRRRRRVEPHQRAGRQVLERVQRQRQEPVGGHHGVLLAAAALAADPAVADRDRARQSRPRRPGRGSPGRRSCRSSRLTWSIVPSTWSRASWSSWLVGSSASSSPGPRRHRDGDRGELAGPRASAGPSGRSASPPRPTSPARRAGRAGPCRPRGPRAGRTRRSRAGVRYGQQVAAGALQHQRDLGGAQPVELARRRPRTARVARRRPCRRWAGTARRAG